MEFNKIWEKSRAPLESFIKTKVNDPFVVKDILQEVSIKLLDNLKRKTSINDYQTWIFQVTRNTIVDHYRKKEKQPKLLATSTEEDVPTNNCVCDLSGFVIKNYLPKEYGTPLYLSDIERKSQKEISQILDLSLTATKSRIQRGRKKLKEVIIEWVNISYNDKGQITDFKIKDHCKLPQELLVEIDKLKLFL